jgi:hypothetical protein
MEWTLATEAASRTAQSVGSVSGEGGIRTRDTTIESLRRLRREHRDHQTVLCEMTGLPHRLFWMRSAWWCQDCRRKIESCCEGGGCPSVAEVLPMAGASTTPDA